MRAFRRFVSLMGAAALVLLSPSSIADELQEYIDTVCKQECVRSVQLMQAVGHASSSFGLDPVSILAIISVESSFRPKAVNGSSVGLTQILKRLHKEKFKGGDPFDVKVNVYAGMKVLSDCLVKHQGVYSKAYACYNGYGSKGAKYAQKVTATYNRLKKIDLSGFEYDKLGAMLRRLKLV